MRKMALLLVAVIAVMVVGCQPPEGMTGGVSQEAFDQLKMQVETLQTDLENTHAALDQLIEDYNALKAKVDKGSAPVPKPPTPKGGRTVKPPEKG
jgi:outer membrane murein-binding lipoprotein Lpp